MPHSHRRGSLIVTAFAVNVYVDNPLVVKSTFTLAAHGGCQEPRQSHATVYAQLKPQGEVLRTLGGNACSLFSLAPFGIEPFVIGAMALSPRKHEVLCQTRCVHPLRPTAALPFNQPYPIALRSGQSFFSRAWPPMRPCHNEFRVVRCRESAIMGRNAPIGLLAKASYFDWSTGCGSFLRNWIGLFGLTSTSLRRNDTCPGV